MCHSVLYAVVIYGIGCVIPTPLQEDSPPPNYPPVLISATPPFGPVAFNTTDSFELAFKADDPNLDEHLYARLFRNNTTSDHISTVSLEPANDPNDPWTRLGTFPKAQYCMYNGPGDYYVVVADRPFSEVSGKQGTAPGGLTDQNHWELSCNGMGM